MVIFCKSHDHLELSLTATCIHHHTTVLSGTLPWRPLRQTTLCH